MSSIADHLAPVTRTGLSVEVFACAVGSIECTNGQEASPNHRTDEAGEYVELVSRNSERCICGQLVDLQHSVCEDSAVASRQLFCPWTEQREQISGT